MKYKFFELVKRQVSMDIGISISFERCNNNKWIVFNV